MRPSYVSTSTLGGAAVTLALVVGCGGRLFEETQVESFVADASPGGRDGGAADSGAQDLGPAVAEISSAGFRMCARGTNGFVYCWGISLRTDSTIAPGPKRVPDIAGATSMSAGQDLGCAVVAGGSLRCWTDGLSDDKTHVYFPRGIFTLPAPATQVSCGDAHCCALTSEGRVNCWGQNEEGQLGNGTRVASDEPVDVELGRRAVSVSAGFLHTCALLADKTVRCWGSNSLGRIGLPWDVPRQTRPVAVAFKDPVYALTARAELSCALSEGGELECCGNNGYGLIDQTLGSHIGSPLVIQELPPIVFVGQPSSNAMCIGTNGSLVICWGFASNIFPMGTKQEAVRSRRSFEMPIPEAAAAVVAVANAVCALSREGHVFCWGGNDSGTLTGVPYDQTSNVPIRVPFPRED